MTASWSRPILSAVSSHPCNCHVYLWALKALPKECISQNLWAKGHEPCSIALLLCTGMRLCRVCTCSQPSRPGATFSASLPGCGAEVAQKKVARKPKEHTFFLLRYWRTHRMKCVLGLVVTAMLLLFISGISMGNIEKSARQMAKEMESERREASAEQAKLRSALAPCGPARLPGQCA